MLYFLNSMYCTSSVTHVIDEIDDLKYPLSQLPKIHVHFIVLREEIN